jgi:hypothetical protein
VQGQVPRHRSVHVTPALAGIIPNISRPDSGKLAEWQDKAEDQKPDITKTKEYRRFHKFA